MTEYAYAGEILRVDLSGAKVWAQRFEEAAEPRKWVGGAGLGARILWDEVPPEAGWDHPENRLVMATGPLAGLPVWGTGGLTVVTRGALTNGATNTQANGFFGANLKYCGYDAIALQGESPDWVWLHIHDGGAELRDAAELLGKDTWETQEALEEKLGLSGHGLSVYSIGPAGREPRALRRHPGRLRPRGEQERLRRRHGEEEAEGGGDRARQEGGGRRPSQGAFRGGGRHRPQPEERPLHEGAVSLRHPGRRAEPPGHGRAPDSQLHDERVARRGRDEAVGGQRPARGLRPPGPSVQRVRDAPLPHARHLLGPLQGAGGGRAGIRGLVGGGLDDRGHGPPAGHLDEHAAGSRLRGT